MARTALLTETAPWLPPMTMSTGLSAVKPQISRPFARSPVNSSPRIGVPVRTALPEGTISRVSGKLQQIFRAA